MCIIQGLKFKFFLSIQLGYQNLKFSIPRAENPVSRFWILVTIGIIQEIQQSTTTQLDNSLIHKNAHIWKGLGGKLVVFKSYLETARLRCLTFSCLKFS